MDATTTTDTATDTTTTPESRKRAREEEEEDDYVRSWFLGYFESFAKTHFKMTEDQWMNAVVEARGGMQRFEKHKKKKVAQYKKEGWPNPEVPFLFDERKNVEIAATITAAPELDFPRACEAIQNAWTTSEKCRWRRYWGSKFVAKYHGTDRHGPENIEGFSWNHTNDVHAIKTIACLWTSNLDERRVIKLNSDCPKYIDARIDAIQSNGVDIVSRILKKGHDRFYTETVAGWLM